MADIHNNSHLINALAKVMGIIPCYVRNTCSAQTHVPYELHGQTRQLLMWWLWSKMALNMQIGACLRVPVTNENEFTVCIARIHNISLEVVD